MEETPVLRITDGVNPWAGYSLAIQYRQLVTDVSLPVITHATNSKHVVPLPRKAVVEVIIR